MTDLSHIKAIAWDFDGVFYRYDAFSDFPVAQRIYNISAAQAACAIMPGLDLEEAAELAEVSFKKYHDIFTAFIPLAEKYGLTETEIKEGIFFEYHKNVYQGMIEKFPEVFASDDDIRGLFNKLSGKVDHMIVTNSCAEYWAKPMLKHMGLDQHFEDSRILGMADFGLHSKSQSPAGITKAVETLDLPPEHIAFIDDSATNLKVAKKAFPALTTIFQGEATELPEGADLILPSKKEFLTQLAQTL